MKKTYLWLLVTGLFVTLAPTVFRYVESQRGNSRVGGEIFFPLLPVFVWIMWREIKNTIQDAKKIFEPED